MTGCNHKYAQALYRAILYFIALHTGLYAVLYSVLFRILRGLRPVLNRIKRKHVFSGWVGGSNLGYWVAGWMMKGSASHNSILLQRKKK